MNTLLRFPRIDYRHKNVSPSSHYEKTKGAKKGEVITTRKKWMLNTYKTKTLTSDCWIDFM